MFLTTPKARLWRWIGLLLTLALGGSYWHYLTTTPRPTGSTFPGLTYGVLAAALVVWLTLFAARKRAHNTRLGTVEGWLQAHVVLGLLVPFVALAHAGFRFEDRIATAAFWLLVVVVLSGVVGSVLYSIVPRLLTEVASNLPDDEVSARLNRLDTAMARLATGRSAAFQEVYHGLRAQARPGVWAGWRLLFSARRLATKGEPRGFAAGLARVGADEQPPLEQLLVLARQRRELALRFLYQQRYKNLLQVWLWTHVPLTAALWVVITVHAVAALYFTEALAP